MIFINTRPSERAEHLSDFLQQQGLHVLEMPLLKLVACDLSEQEIQYLHQLSQPNFYQTLVFISETAVNYFFVFIQHHYIVISQDLTFIAVGQKTAQTFNQHWQKFYATTPNLITPSQFKLSENNEGLLQLAVIQQLQKDDNVFILKGKEGRTLFKNTLIEKGVNIHEVNFYQRIFPKQSTQIFQQFSQNYKISTKPIVLITSLTAWQYWQSLVNDTFKLTDFCYIVLQQRIVNSILQSTKAHLKLIIIVIDDLQPMTIWQAIKPLKEI